MAFSQTTSDANFGLHHCNGIVEAIEMDISFVYFGVRMKKILNAQEIIGC
jgi:hypothetical protein